MELERGSGWSFVGPTRVRRGADAGARVSLDATVPSAFLRDGVSVAEVREVVSSARRGGERSPLELSVQGSAGERYVLLMRHPSGALTFHPPLADDTIRRGTKSEKARGGRTTFRVELAEAAPLRRGLLSASLKLIVVKVKEELVDAAVSLGIRLAAREAETLWWKHRGLREGWQRVRAAAKSLTLAGASAEDFTEKRALLFLHGTFSDTASSFSKLLRPDVFAALSERYEDRIFAFNHFSVSRSLEENARALLEVLPDRANVFDVVAYSRGGLVLRMLAERPERFGALARRFRFEQGVLVAVPNGGTPLATGRRWEETFGFVANLLELLPDNPWTTGAQFVADGIVWLASHLSGDLPGLADMDADGETIASLQEGNGPVSGDYSALGANFHPDANIWARLLDAGIDGFFASANDLVVPTAGAWGIDPAMPAAVPAERVGVFGSGGNIRPRSGGAHHLNVLAQDETEVFIKRALRGEAQQLPAIDLAKPLPTRKPWRGLTAGNARMKSGAELRSTSGDRFVSGLASANVGDTDRTLHLMILGEPGVDSTAQLLAMYGSARVVEPFALRKQPGALGSGTRFGEIIEMHERIQMNLEGRIAKKTQRVPELPSDEQLRDFGGALFDTLFAGRVRRLYDVARSEQRATPLNVVFTCAIPWVAAKPWEFAFDPNRGKFLATEEIHFVRNVLTAVPAQRLDAPRPRLRLLVIEAQPADTVPLASEEEETRIRHRFQPLIDGGLVEIDVLARATPATLHETIVSHALEQRPYDVAHFIGHGEFDREANEGRLIFDAGDGAQQPVGVQTLREILCGRGLQLVFLNACDTARDPSRKLNRGVAQALVQGGLPAVVANQYKVLDPSAVAFAQHFYWALAQGASLGEAAREARIAVNYSLEGEVIDWAVSVLYARDPDQRLCTRTQAAAPLTQPPGTPPRRRPSPAARVQKVRRTPPPLSVAVADIARFFPSLAAILERLNAVQSRFQFRLVEINVPMGVWQKIPGEQRTYLNAARFAEKLKTRPHSLGVDVLACVTNWWLRDNTAADLHGWWSDDPEVPIVIFSTAGLALPANDPQTSRVIGNGLTGSLASYFLAANSKAAGVRSGRAVDDVFYFGAGRNFARMTERQHFPPASRALLRKHLPSKLDPPATLAALEALLGAFDDGAGMVR